MCYTIDVKHFDISLLQHFNNLIKKLNFYEYTNVIVYLKNFSEKNKYDQHRDVYSSDSSEIKTKRVKSRKQKHKRQRDNSESKPTNNNLANESAHHAIKLFVSFDNLKNSRKIKNVCI